MKFVVVIAGNLVQFQDFVKSVEKKRIFVHSCRSKIIIEGITFLFVQDYLRLCGYDLGERAELVKVGTWYELPALEIEKIEKMFQARKR
jgi:TPP-dependent indolepyruvate ferredoxin oxidoreductase alpha subunit